MNALMASSSLQDREKNTFVVQITLSVVLCHGSLSVACLVTLDCTQNFFFR